MEMHQIKYFLAVACEKHISRAAERCNVSQPSLSRAIRKLEEELGAPLFDRKPSGVELTDLGRQLQPIFRRCLEQAAEAKEKAAAFSGTKSMQLRLGVMTTLYHPQLIGVLAAITQQFPNADVQIIQTGTRRLLDALSESQMEAALFSRPGALDLADAEDITIESLYWERYALCCPQGHRFTAQNSVTLDEARQELLLDLAGQQDVASASARTQGGQETLGRYSLSSQCLAHALVRSGLGCAILPEFSPPGLGVEMRPLHGLEARREVCLGVAAGRQKAPLVAAFVQSLRAAEWMAGSI